MYFGWYGRNECILGGIEEMGVFWVVWGGSLALVPPPQEVD